MQTNEALETLKRRTYNNSPFIKRTEEFLNKGALFSKMYDFRSYKRSMIEEENSKAIAYKANLLRNNIPGGFVNRRKSQMLGFKLLRVLQ